MSDHEEEEDTNTPTLDMDSSTLSRLTHFLRSLPVPAPDTAEPFRLFERRPDPNGRNKYASVYYCAFGGQARDLAESYVRTTGDLRRLPDGTVSQTISLSLFSRVVGDLLLRRRVPVEVYSCDSGAWRLQRRGTPGNPTAFEEELGADASLRDEAQAARAAVSLTAAVRIVATSDGFEVGVAFAHPVERRCYLASLNDDRTLTSLEVLLGQIGATEVLCLDDGAGGREGGEGGGNHGNGGAEGVKRPGKRARDAAAEALRRALEGAGVLQTPLKRARFRELRPGEAAEAFPALAAGKPWPEHLELPLALSALSALAHHLELFEDSGSSWPSLSSSSSSSSSSIPSLPWRLSLHSPSSFCRLDRAARTALGLDALFAHLNRCVSAPGSRTLWRWLRQPLARLPPILERQSMVSALVDGMHPSGGGSAEDEEDEDQDDEKEDEGKDGGGGAPRSAGEVRDGLAAALKGLPDAHRLCGKLVRGSAGLGDVAQVYRVLARAQHVARILAGVSAFAALRRRLRRALADCGGLSALIETAMDVAALRRGEFRVSSALDEGIAALQRGLDALLARSASEIADFGGRWGLQVGKELHAERTEALGIHWRATPKAAKPLLKELTSGRNVDGMVRVDKSAKTGLRFRTRKSATLAEEEGKLRKIYDAKCREATKELVRVAASYAEPLERAAEALGEADALLALASVAGMYGYVRPELWEFPPEVGDVGEGLEEDDEEKEREREEEEEEEEEDTHVLRMLQARHPVLDAELQAGFVPNDARFSRRRRVQVITGPNMGGKSTFLKTVALCALLAQIGGFVPARPCAAQGPPRLPVFRAIFCRVGAGDCLLKGESTFMTEMVDVARILSGARASSLVLLDELGRGTSTHEGVGIAYGVVRALLRRRCFVLMATHFQELAAAAQRQRGMVNRHVAAVRSEKTGEMTFLYALREGHCGRSFGIAIADMVGFPETIVAHAKRLAAQLEDFELEGRKRRKLEQPGAGPETETETEAAAVQAFAKMELKKPGKNLAEENRAELVQKVEGILENLRKF